jgi:LL-diaminopimelate aminotransferase
MPILNQNYTKLKAGYLFPEIAKRVRDFQAANPDKEIIKLGIGDTVLPLAPSVVKAMLKKTKELEKDETYTGYGESEGDPELRKAISNYYKNLNCEIDFDDVFVSDGAKTDSANIASIFETSSTIAVQDPSYPVYVDTNVIYGRTGEANEMNQYEGIKYLVSNPENSFLPNIPEEKIDLIYLCFPNNPTGVMATREYLERWVEYALNNQSIIIYDAAYSWFISDINLPKSIYEIKGANSCAIEIQSFSKFAGFTGVRLGWSVVPKNLICENTKPGDIQKIWTRRQNTMFNGASNIVQAGGIAALSQAGMKENQELIDYYMKNAKTIKTKFTNLGYEVFGGEDAPYIWVRFEGKTSWEVFDYFLNEYGIVVTPGSGFGPSGEGFIRISSFAKKENVAKAMRKIV